MSLLLLLSAAFAGETGVLQGVVLGPDGAPARGVELVVDLPTDDAVVTIGPDGGFLVELPPGAWSVQCKLSDRTIPLEPVSIASGKATELLVSLGPEGGSAIVSVEAPVDGSTAADVAVGTVTGRVVDAAGAPVVGARIYARGQAVQATTDTDGRYAIEVPQGTCDLSVIASGFASRSVSGIAVGDQPVVADVELVSAGLSLSELSVKAPRIEGGTATLLEERRDSASVSDVLGAEQMKKSGDSDAASALRRATGLTVVGGRYVYVRGLGDRYSATLLNGATLPSPEPEKRVVPLDLFPTSLIEGITIEKSFSPDRPAEFGGGVVRIETRGVPTERIAQLGLSGTFVGGTTFRTATTGARGPTDFLGVDGGFRALPDEIAVASADQPLKPRGIFSDEGYTAEELERLGELVENRWGLTSRTLPPDIGISATYGDSIETGGPRLGGIVGWMWNNGQAIDAAVRNVYSASDGELTLRRSTDYVQYTNRIRLGGVVSLGADWGEEQGISSTTLLNRVSEYRAVLYDADDPTGSSDTRSTRLEWIEQQLFFEQVAGHHTVAPKLGSAVDWRYALSIASRAEPDRREYTYVSTDDGYLLSQKGTWNEIRYGTLRDTNHDAGLDLVQPVLGEGRVQVGVGSVLRDRTSTTRRFSYEFSGSDGIDLSKPLDEILVPENIGAEGEGDPGFLVIEELTSNSDDYTARQRLFSTYALTELPFGRFRMLVGARLERSVQTVQTFELFNPAAEPVSAELATTDLLPAATVTMAVGPEPRRDDLLVRIGYGRTLSRPEFRELSSVPYSDFKTGALVYGEPTLQRAIIDNVDARFEYYPRPGESLSVAGFYKAFAHPIESIVEVSAVSGSASTFANATRATNLGVEVDARKSLDFVHERLADLFVAANAAGIVSRVDLSEAGGNQTSSTRALQGQSPYVVNVQAGYDNPVTGTSVTVLYNVFGPRITEVGQSGIPDTFELPVHRLDAALLFEPVERLQVGLKGQNLLDWPVRQRTGSEIAEETRDGWSVGASVGVSL